MLLDTAALSQAQPASSELTGIKATVVGRDAATGAWLLELDHGIDTAGGRARTVQLQLDERRGPAMPIVVGERLGVDGRLDAPGLPGGVARLEPTRIEHLSGADLRHVYFLFRSGRSEGCAECYVPLLLTAEALTAASGATDGEVIVTFERDSIWEIRDRPVRLTDIAPLPRTLMLDGRPYRYQEVALQEAIRLLKNPLGSIPISRPMLADAPTPTRRRALLFRLGVIGP